ncbi:class I SAM-dependent rRNA methyltransferase [Desulfovibrio sp. X2]|uniref:class I SAM-dependent rRNA methyltransferase n=1 Tax=Desulfovibrio sp. X2 TaxID=941449 RepID=UPI001268B675|nr:class I SAM-dependent rRNA methyltransferase [Desulfovibrio sp. X2]
MQDTDSTTPPPAAPDETPRWAKTLILKKGEERRLRIGHLWLFSNEVDTRRTPLKGLTPGEAVRIEDSRGDFVANGYANPGSLIAARLVSRRPSEFLDEDLLRRRLGQALALRERLFSAPFYRLCYAEGDFLPGLVVDRYGDVLVVQLGTAGMERARDLVVETLMGLVKPRAVLLKNDSQARAYEGLPEYVETAYGTVPDEVEVEENGARYTAPLASGQKTGWFYDQRLNRARLAAYAGGASVLDLFSYVGSFGVLAALSGASSVTCVDGSARALDAARESAERNGVAGRVRTVEADVFAAMEALQAEGRTFDVICLDPPAFIKHRKDQAKGEQAYVKANREAMKLLSEDGVLMTCSCSQHLEAEALRRVVLRAAGQNRASAQILEQGHQGPDHPVNPAMPETNYLKSFVCRILR